MGKKPPLPMLRKVARATAWLAGLWLLVQIAQLVLQYLSDRKARKAPPPTNDLDTLTRP